MKCSWGLGRPQKQGSELSCLAGGAGGIWKSGFLSLKCARAVGSEARENPPAGLRKNKEAEEAGVKMLRPADPRRLRWA